MPSDHEQALVQISSLPEKVDSNFSSADDKLRKGTILRFKPGAASLNKLGHFGLNVSDFTETLKFFWGSLHSSFRTCLYMQDGKGCRGNVPSQSD